MGAFRECAEITSVSVVNFGRKTGFSSWWIAVGVCSAIIACNRSKPYNRSRSGVCICTLSPKLNIAINCNLLFGLVSAINSTNGSLWFLQTVQTREQQQLLTYLWKIYEAKRFSHLSETSFFHFPWLKNSAALESPFLGLIVLVTKKWTKLCRNTLEIIPKYSPFPLKLLLEIDQETFGNC